MYEPSDHVQEERGQRPFGVCLCLRTEVGRRQVVTLTVKHEQFYLVIEYIPIRVKDIQLLKSYQYVIARFSNPRPSEKGRT